MKDIMLDLETLGTQSTAAIIQIGACYFNRDTGEIGDTFYTNVTPDLKSFTVDWETIKWWMLQSQEARESVTANARPLLPVIEDLYDFLNKDGVSLWSHASFDTPIIENAFRVSGLKFPVRYFNIRDIRTLMDLANHRGSKERTGVHHDALDDCKFQVKYCVEAIKILKNRYVA